MRYQLENKRFGFKPLPIQKGYGFGSIFARILQKIVPFTKKAANTLSQTGSKILANQTVKNTSRKLLDSGIDIAANV